MKNFLNTCEQIDLLRQRAAIELKHMLEISGMSDREFAAKVYCVGERYLTVLQSNEITLHKGGYAVIPLEAAQRYAAVLRGGK